MSQPDPSLQEREAMAELDWGPLPVYLDTILAAMDAYPESPARTDWRP